jgi:hypothetical protein
MPKQEPLLSYDENGEPANRFTSVVEDWHEYGDFHNWIDGQPDAEHQARVWKLDPNLRWIMIRRYDHGKRAELSSHADAADAANQHDADPQGYGAVTLIDLETGDEYRAVSVTTWHRT